MFVVVILADISDLQTSHVIDTSPLFLFGGQNKHRKYVAGRISNEVVVFIIFFMFVSAILNISISQKVPEWHEQYSIYI